MVKLEQEKSDAELAKRLRERESVCVCDIKKDKCKKFFLTFFFVFFFFRIFLAKKLAANERELEDTPPPYSPPIEAAPSYDSPAPKKGNKS